MRYEGISCLVKGAHGEFCTRNQFLAEIYCCNNSVSVRKVEYFPDSQIIVCLQNDLLWARMAKSIPR